MVRRYFALLIASLTLAGSLPAAEPLPFTIQGDRSVRVLWGQVFASLNDDWINDLVLLREGNILAAGFLNRLDQPDGPSDWSAFTAELTPDGRVAAQRTYGEGGGLDAFFAAREADDQRRVLAGFTTRIGGGGINAYVLVARPDGLIIKENAFGGGGYDRFTGVAPTDGGYVFLGHSQAQGEAVKRRVYLVKTDIEALPLWERIHDAPESWGALNIERTGDGGFIIAGGTSRDGDGDMFAMKVDSEGRELWRRRVGTSDWDEINHGLVLRSNGDVVLVGYAHRRGEEANDLVAATLSPDGELRRLERFGGSGDDRTILARADRAGQIWIVGHSASAGAGGDDLVLARLDVNGSYEPAALTIGGPQTDRGTAILPLEDGSVLLAGYSTGLGRGRQDAFLLRLSAPAFDRANPAFRRTVVTPAR